MSFKEINLAIETLIGAGLPETILAPLEKWRSDKIAESIQDNPPRSDTEVQELFDGISAETFRRAGIT